MVSRMVDYLVGNLELTLAVKLAHLKVALKVLSGAAM